MAKLSEKLKFEIEYPSGTWVQVYPTNEDFVFKKTREETGRIFTLEMDTDPVFKKDASWDFISDIEVNDHCADLNIRVTCPLEGGVTLYEGKVRLSKSEFNFSDCVARIKTQPEDGFTCLKDGLKKQINVLPLVATTSRKTLNMSIGTLEYQYCPGPTEADYSGNIAVSNPFVLPVQDSCLSELDGWVALENKFRFITGGSAPWTAQNQTRWVRLTVDSATEPPGEGWTNIGGTTWVKSPEVVFDFENSSTGFGTESTYQTIYQLSYSATEPIDNGMLFSDMLSAMLGSGGINCPLTVVSNFFSISADGTNPSNDAYTKAQAGLANLIVFQQSDVKRPSVSENATVAYLKMEELLAWLYDMFKVIPYISGTTLYLEHVSYFESNPVSLDLTASPYDKWTKRKNSYKYKEEETPRYEFFKWQADSYASGKFRTAGILYGSACAGTGEDVTHQLVRVNTDIESILLNPSNFEDDGFVFVAAALFDGEYYAVDEPLQGFSAVTPINGHLSFRNLIPYYHRWQAYQETASGVDLATLTIVSTRATKENEPVTISGWCCTDFINFGPDSKVTMPTGDSDVVSVEFSVRNGTATFETEL